MGDKKMRRRKQAVWDIQAGLRLPYPEALGYVREVDGRRNLKPLLYVGGWIFKGERR